MKKSTTSSFVLSLKLNTSIHDEAVLSKRFYCGMKIYNVVCRHAQKLLPSLWNDDEYISLLTQRKKALDKKELRSLNERLSVIRMKYGLSKYQLFNFVKVQQHIYKNYIDSRTAQGIASAVWEGCEKVIFSKGKQLHCHRYDDFYSMESNSNDTGIRFVNGVMVWNKLTIPVRLDKNDIYECQALKNRIKYCRIVRRPMGTKYHYYLQIVLEGIPPLKHIYGTGNVGIDIGTSTCATVSASKVDLFTLGDDIANLDKQISRLQKAMERSKRATNPGNFNADGTVIKGKHKWCFSHNYKQLRFKKHALETRRAAAIKQTHERHANEILEQGNEVFVEDMCFNGLQRKAKNTTVNKKGRFNRKKRFGKSLKNHAPAMFISIINRKLGYRNKEIHKVDTKTFRASQYNHVTNDYVKKKLSKRWNYFPDETKIQRDLYSAFLLMNSSNNLTHTNRELCFKTFDTFKQQHDTLIQTLTTSNKKYPSSFGIKKVA